MIEVGTLVRYKSDGDIGLVIKVVEDCGHFVYWIKWGDGSYHSFVASEFEVIA